MTSHKVQIQELIQSIDGVLSKATPRLPWVMAGEAEQQRLVLEQARQYLTHLQQQADAPPELPAAPTPPALPGAGSGTSAGQVGESAQQVLQAVLQEVTYLRTNIMQPMRSDVDRLRQERDELEREVRELKAQRQQYALPPQGGDASQQMLSEFLQSLMGRLQENLTVQVSEMVTDLQQRSGNAAIAGTDARSLTGSPPAGLSSEALAGNTPGAGQALTSLTPQERLEQLQRIQAQSDQLLLKLDTTLRVIFESLQRNMHTYEESLSRGLDKMHTLGHQGEAIFTALVNRLAQQLGREASSYLQASLQSVNWQALPESANAAGAQPSLSNQGTALSDSQSVLDSLLSELTDGEATILQPTPPRGDRRTPTPPPEDFPDLNLELPDEFPQATAAQAWEDDGEMTRFQIDEEPLPDLVADPLAEEDFADEMDDDEEMTIFQMETPFLGSQVGADSQESAIEDIDSALELLNQISTDLEADETETPSPEAEVASPEGIYNELDALYESLFGTDLAPTDELEEDPVDRHVADAAQLERAAAEALEAEDEFTAALNAWSEEEAEEPAEEEAEEPAATQAEPLDADAARRERELEEFESQLFEGLADLSTDEDRTAEERDDTEIMTGAEASDWEDTELDAELEASLLGLSAESAPRAVESLLFDEVPVADEGEQEETLLLNTPTNGQDLPADVITSLEDLIHLNDASASLDLLRSEDITNEDVYIAAAPDEDLLAEDEETPRTALDVDQDLVQQLDAELARLEGATAADLELPDSELSDLELPDSELPDSELPDSELPDSELPDSELPDSAMLLDELESDFEADTEPDEPPTDFASNLGLADELTLGLEPAEPRNEILPPLTADDFLPSEAEAIAAGLPELGDNAPLPPPSLTPPEPEPTFQSEAEAEGEEETLGLGLDDWLSEDLPAAPVSGEFAAADEPLFAAEHPPEDNPPFPTEVPLEVENRFDAGAEVEASPVEVAEAGLPPAREDLTLDDFQSVMAEPLETFSDEPLWEGFEEGEEDDPDRTLLMPPQGEIPDFSEPSTAEPDGGDQDEEETLEGFSNYLFDLPTASSTPIEPPAPSNTRLDLAALFEEADVVPDPVDVPPPGEEDLSFASFADAIASEEPPSPDTSDDSFTLEGLGDLFEDEAAAAATPTVEQQPEPTAPSTDAALREATAPDQMASEALGSDFGLAEVDFFAEMDDDVEMASGAELELKSDAAVEAEAKAEAERAKKKDLTALSPEDSANPTGSAIAPNEELTFPPTIGPTEVVDLSEQLLQAMGLAAEAEEAEEEPFTEDMVEEWSDADLSLMDLADDFSGASGAEMNDPELLSLLQRLDARATYLRRTQPTDPATAPIEDQLSDLRSQEQDLDFLISPSVDPLDELYEEFAPPSPSRSSRRQPTEPVWYLSIDLGTTGISAVLLNRQTQTLYPLYWLEVKFPDPVQGGIPAPEKTYRLPAAVYLNTTSRAAQTDVAIASLSAAPIPSHRPDRIPLQDFKPYLRAGIPYSTPDNVHWEPVLQWTEQRVLPLSQVHQALRTLLATLNCLTPDLSQASNAPVLSCGAVGLSDERLQDALQHLAGVIVSHPANGSDTYSFNVREAVLAARLVDHPEQIYLVDEAIATLLSALPSETEAPIQFPDHLSPKPDLCNAPWQGGTLVLNAGASLTEMALVNLPNQLQTLSHPDFAIRTIPYGGNALDQDILCQLVYPAWVRQAHRPSPGAATAAVNLSLPGANNPASPEAWADPWAVLNWEQLTLPIVGDPDPANRYALHRQLLSSAVGLGMLEVAQHLKRLLQQQDRAVVRIGEVPLVMTRQDLASRVLLPYIQRLNRELNGLLTQSGLSALGVNQVLCAGGTASLAAIARWLRQKFPNATFVQDTYPLTYPPQHNQLAACGRVAFGLATVPLHPQVLNVSRHQYSDYFLLMELLRTFPEAPITFPSLLQMLERRGINTQKCQTQLLALLQGHLPPGLVPLERDAYLLTQESQHNPDYQALLEEPLFIQEDAETYRPNPQQWPLFRRYVDTLLATSYQKLTDPLGFAIRSGLEVTP